MLRGALDGSGPALAPIGPHDGRAPDVATTVPDRVALVVNTSGSTGEPRRVMLDARALLASACATHERLAGGTGGVDHQGDPIWHGVGTDRPARPDTGERRCADCVWWRRRSP